MSAIDRAIWTYMLHDKDCGVRVPPNYECDCQVKEAESELKRLQARDEYCERLKQAAREANEQLLELLLWIDGWEPIFTDDEAWPSAERKAKNARESLDLLLKD